MVFIVELTEKTKGCPIETALFFKNYFMRWINITCIYFLPKQNVCLQTLHW
jgi:hypothetical protein